MNDLISRQAALDMIDAIFPVDPTKSEYAQGIACGAALAKTYVEQLPSAQPEKMQLSTEKMQLSNEDATKDATFDCISREDAIYAVKHHMNNVSGGNDEYYIAHRHIIELLQIVPTAEPESRREWYMHGYRDAQPRWIPCEERLPEEQDEYLVTWVSKLHTGKRFVGIGIFEYDLSEDNWLFDDYMNAYVDVTVTAWMPLPPSYKGDEDERN